MGTQKKSLDQRLKGILEGHAGNVIAHNKLGIKRNDGRYLFRLKNAFADDGYIKPLKITDHTSALEAFYAKQFYDKFMKELESVPGYQKRGDILYFENGGQFVIRAARRAAGLEK